MKVAASSQVFIYWQHNGMRWAWMTGGGTCHARSQLVSELVRNLITSHPHSVPRLGPVPSRFILSRTKERFLATAVFGEVGAEGGCILRLNVNHGGDAVARSPPLRAEPQVFRTVCSI